MKWQYAEREVNMKKTLKMITLLAAFALLLVACGAKKEESKTFVLDNGVVNTELTYYYVGDKVTKQTTKTILKYGQPGFEDKEAVKEKFDPIVAKYQGIEGIEHKIEYGETEVTEELSMDYSKIDYDKLKGLEGMTFAGDPKNGVSMKKSEEMLLANGFTLK